MHSKPIQVLLVQGANMEYLGIRQPEIYGTTTLNELHEQLVSHAKTLQITLDIRTTNLEGEAITWAYEADRKGYDAMLINPAGFTYAGYALRDCIKALIMPTVEVHMSNIERRGMKSVTAEASVGVITGFGRDSYIYGLNAIVDLMKGKS